jgi:hypothetical protein
MKVPPEAARVSNENRCTPGVAQPVPACHSDASDETFHRDNQRACTPRCMAAAIWRSTPKGVAKSAVSRARRSPFGLPGVGDTVALSVVGQRGDGVSVRMTTGGDVRDRRLRLRRPTRRWDEPDNNCQPSPTPRRISAVLVTIGATTTIFAEGSTAVSHIMQLIGADKESEEAALSRVGRKRSRQSRTRQSSCWVRRAGKQLAGGAAPSFSVSYIIAPTAAPKTSGVFRVW